MDRITILSIDFDFFQQVSIDTLRTCYPDGVDVPTMLSKITWAGHYNVVSEAEKLIKVTTNRAQLDQMKSILSQCENCRNVMIANSHLRIYEFIHEIMEQRKSSYLDIINCDMHHDMVNDNIEVDCGNWLGRIAEEYDTRIKWIANPISKKVFGIEDERFNAIETKLDIINPKAVDAVFLARSDNWTPPHLDKDFKELYDHIADTFSEPSRHCPVLAERGIMEPRTLGEILQQLDSFTTRKIGSDKDKK